MRTLRFYSSNSEICGPIFYIETLVSFSTFSLFLLSVFITTRVENPLSQRYIVSNKIAPILLKLA